VSVASWSLFIFIPFPFGRCFSYQFAAAPPSFFWWDWGSNFMLAKQTLYLLSHTSSPFCFAFVFAFFWEMES
jgi:hypothetical protein